MTKNQIPTDCGWRAAAVAVATVGWGANQFAPLLLMYRAELGLSPAVSQATFGLYAAGLIPGLLLGGPVSDRFGRRRVLLPSLVISLLASLLLIAGGTGLGWLFAGRLVAGVASGAAFSSGTAWIKELSRPGAPGEPNPGARRATVAMTAGFGAGPLVAGMLAQWGPAHTVLPYLPHLALCVVALPLAWRTPETRAASRPDGSRPEAWSPAARRRFLGVVAPLAPWVFGSATVALAYLPGLVAHRLAGQALLFSALVTTLPALSGIAAQPLARRAAERPARLLATSLIVVIVGLLLAAGASAAGDPVLVAVACLALGAAYGYCQVCGLQEVQRLAPPHRLARLTAGYQALSYLGFALPYLLAAGQRWWSPPALLLATAALAAVTLGGTARSASTERGTSVRV